LVQFINDPEKEVRDELRGIFRNQDLITDTKYAAFVKDYIKSQAFADDPDHFVWSLRDLAGSLISVADAIPGWQNNRIDQRNRTIKVWPQIDSLGLKEPKKITRNHITLLLQGTAKSPPP
jgi:hypothetical protein